MTTPEQSWRQNLDPQNWQQGNDQDRDCMTDKVSQEITRLSNQCIDSERDLSILNASPWESPLRRDGTESPLFFPESQSSSDSGVEIQHPPIPGQEKVNAKSVGEQVSIPCVRDRSDRAARPGQAVLLTVGNNKSSVSSMRRTKSKASQIPATVATPSARATIVTASTALQVYLHTPSRQITHKDYARDSNHKSLLQSNPYTASLRSSQVPGLEAAARIPEREVYPRQLQPVSRSRDRSYCLEATGSNTRSKESVQRNAMIADLRHNYPSSPESDL